MPLPHFGITQEVRVCDSCYTKLNKKSNKIHRPSQSLSSSRHRSARDLADAELQRAIQLSLEEVGAAGGRRPGYVPSPSSWQSSEPPLVDRKTRPYAGSSTIRDEEDDPDLKAAIEASLREASAPKPSAPFSIETPTSEQPSSYANGYGFPQSYPPSSATPKPKALTSPNYDLEPLEADAILTFNQTVGQVQAQGITDLSRYPAVTELYDKASALRPKLAMSLNDTGRKEQALQEMHEKLSQAVKLYDNLLTEQVSRPAWRSPSTVPSTSYQHVNAGYAPQYRPADGVYGQWAAEPQAQTPVSPRTQGQYRAPESSYYDSSQHEPRSPVSAGTYTASVGLSSLNAQRQTAGLEPQQFGSSSLPLSSAYQPLARSHTVAAHPAHAPPPPPSTYLHRHNTTSHAPQQLHQLQQLTTPPQLPNFPVAPTVLPQQYSTYESPAPSVAESERKEALLIDL
ncbi:uncharacterized protein FIBRA_05855 [Fibroporia radiculosa]|uniref:Uncharacterized protein n=1 Tax=Fibroporia radiculosa TaxID=599839 RepID=J4H3R6_9APHY|nr:uncharacterized protein FIBRA_05855 [Fibroporia radiculosa]CCM03709.1 predicted protein [Fibroporia radiculosa]